MWIAIAQAGVDGVEFVSPNANMVEALDRLKENGWIARGEDGRWRITVGGAEALLDEAQDDVS
jgi:predicted transcriptional regulator of viral defense system